MIIPFELNGERVLIDTNPGERLVRILRGRFGLLDSKEGCLSGRCGSCMVLMDGKPIPSCLVPVFQVKDASIQTLESFRKTAECADVIEGFKAAKVSMCGFCDAGKILIAHAAIERYPRPTEAEIRAMYSGSICRCTSIEDLVAGVKNAANIRRRRIDAK